MRRSLLFVATVALAACHRPDPVGDDLPRVLAAPTDTIAGTGTVEELQARLAQWTATRGGRDYEFTVERGCFCMEAARRAVVVRVVGDRVASVRDAETGKAPAIEFAFPSIEGLFAGAIDDARAGRGHPVTYAGAGYPLQISVGAVEVDAGSTYTISRVTLSR